jgi:hypothetical protein
MFDIARVSNKCSAFIESIPGQELSNKVSGKDCPHTWNVKTCHSELGQITDSDWLSLPCLLNTLHFDMLGNDYYRRWLERTLDRLKKYFLITIWAVNLRAPTSQCTSRSSVTGLDEFSPNGWLFTLGSGLKITEVAPISGQLFPRYRLCINFDNKIGWATFGATFSQTHLVTLQKSDKSKKCSPGGVV